MNDRRSDQAARRAYWAKSMEAAADFMHRLAECPVNECGEELVPLPEAAARAGVEMTFSERPHFAGGPRLFYLRAGLTDALMTVGRQLNDRGWALHVEDAYRTVAMQRDGWLNAGLFGAILEQVKWELDGRAPDAALLHRRMEALLALSPRVGAHMSGSAVDVSVYRLQDGTEVDRGGPYPTMSEVTPMDSPWVGAEARAHRDAIRGGFERCGFLAYPWEFWHFNQGDIYEQILRGDARRARYGPVHFDPATGRIEPVEHPEEPLVPVEEIDRMIRAALA